MNTYFIDEKAVVVKGRLVHAARLRDEHYAVAGDPQEFIAKMRSAGVRADLFSFVQEIHDPVPKYPFHREEDDLAVLRLTSYEDWWKSIKDKTRNMIRKAQKNGVEIRVAELNDDLIRGIREVYMETPIRQGRRNVHYGKDFETVKREHVTYRGISDFIGAFYEGKLIGFVKVSHLENCSLLINIVAMIAHRDKAPTNALIAKTVEVCAKRNVRFLNYGTWGRRPGLNDFKIANGFQSLKVPRYYIPLNWKGQWVLKLDLHHGLAHYLPDKVVSAGADLRTRWNGFRYRHQIPIRGSSSIGRASR